MSEFSRADKAATFVFLVCFVCFMAWLELFQLEVLHMIIVAIGILLGIGVLLVVLIAFVIILGKACGAIATLCVEAAVRLAIVFQKMKIMLDMRHWPTKQRALRRLAHIQAMQRTAQGQLLFLEMHQPQYGHMSEAERCKFDELRIKYSALRPQIENMIFGSQDLFFKYKIKIPPVELPKVNV